MLLIITLECNRLISVVDLLDVVCQIIVPPVGDYLNMASDPHPASLIKFMSQIKSVIM